MPRLTPGWIRIALVGAALLVAGLACNLTDDDTPTPTPQSPLAVATLTPSPVFIIVTPTLTPTDIALPDPTQAPPTIVNCTPQTTWPVYTVVPGDTLSQIALRTGATTAQLTQANCLSNPGLIYVGQALYVPVVPAQPTAAPTANPQLPAFTEYLTVDPYWLDASGQPVTYSDAVRVSVGEVLNADTVRFFVNDPAGGGAISIGEDLDPWDGAFVDYAFPAAGSYTFQAAAINDVGSLNSTIFTMRYDPTFNPPSGQRNLLTLAPYLRVEGSALVVQPGATLTISWPDAPVGALRVDFLLFPTGTEVEGSVIGSDLDPSNGASAAWQVPARGILGHLQAVATMPDESTQSSELLMVYSGP